MIVSAIVLLGLAVLLELQQQPTVASTLWITTSKRSCSSRPVTRSHIAAAPL